MIDCVKEALQDAKYEAATRPGEGPKFEATLLAAAQHLDKALDELKKAEAMLPYYEA
jgi:hypothetical protein